MIKEELDPGTVADVVIEDVRSNDRVLADDVTLAAHLYSRAQPFLLAEIEGYELVGFNERRRFYRYQPGYMRMTRWEESQLTIMIFLNEGMIGRETRFFADMG